MIEFIHDQGAFCPSNKIFANSKKEAVSSFKGWAGEKKAAFNLMLSLNERTYKRFNNLIIPSSNGTAQIDHLVVSPYGIFIIETKNKKGWIFGSENQKNWTQVIYGNKYSFQNPLKQTYRQKKVLAEFLGIKVSAIHSIIYFIGDSEFKTPMPDNVIDSKPARYIKSFIRPVFTDERMVDIASNLSSFKYDSNLKTSDHVRSLRQRHNSTTTCPRCGNDLVVRTAKHGPKSGN